ncbi:hypothetical protein GCM10023350_30260 [Nocardioides endophyticus]|uniref:DNA-binding protein n=1 Tax=Nocardioides endophyticus TaxID=1353775 RepID=A0ABP8Z158_9ACTN
MDGPDRRISDALEHLALTLGESGAVPMPELVRALERAAERLRTRSAPVEAPHDLVTQSEASRTIGVSRQAVNQWVRKGTLRSYVGTDAAGRQVPQVSLSEVAVAANRKAPAPLSSSRRRELVRFLDLIAEGSLRHVAEDIRFSLDDEWPTEHYADESRVLREFVTAAMDSGDRQREFTAEGVRLLADLNPKFEIDPSAGFGRLADRLGLLITSSNGLMGFDSPSTAILGLLGVATVGTQYAGPDTEVAETLARAAEEVWGTDWTLRLFDAAFHMGELRPSPLTRYTASLVYLDNNRFLRQAQASGISIAYSRGPGPVLPQRFYGGAIFHDILHGTYRGDPVWSFTPEAAAAVGPPSVDASSINPFRVFNYEYGLLDAAIHGIRRYCYSVPDVRAGLQTALGSLSATERETYLRTAVETMARTVALPHVELVAIGEPSDFDWWKDHVIRSSEREILIGLRDDRARRIAHALLVQTSMLPDVVEAADSDGSLRDRLRIYVKNLEFDVVEARYRDDLRRGVMRILKPGGRSLTVAESRELAEREIASYLA